MAFQIGFAFFAIASIIFIDAAFVGKDKGIRVKVSIG